MGTRSGDSVWGHGVGTRCVCERGVGTDSVWRLGVGTRCRDSVVPALGDGNRVLGTWLLGLNQ